MKIEVSHQAFKYITDNSSECSQNTAFIQTAQNGKFLQDAKNNQCTTILSPKQAFNLLNINKQIKIVGITGTNGKTTTAALIYSMLLDLGKNVAFQGTRGFFINATCKEEKSLTTPPYLQTLHHLALAAKEKCDYFVMEVSSHAIAQKRIEDLEFALKIFTNLSQDHLDFHKSMQEYIHVKSSFFDDVGLKLINKDDPHIQYNLKGTRTYGIENSATYKINAYSLQKGIEAVLTKKDKVINFSSPLRGFFNLYNLTCAISAVDLLENPDEEKLAKVVENFAGVSGRMEVIHENPTVIVDFAHTPDGMKKVLEAMKNENLKVLFGAGGDRDKTKRPLMAKVASLFCKKIYITSDNPRSENPLLIIEDIKKGLHVNKDVTIELDREKAIHMALSNLANNETLLVLGKGDETYQEINGIKYPFDDREVIKQFYTKNGSSI